MIAMIFRMGKSLSARLQAGNLTLRQLSMGAPTKLICSQPRVEKAKLSAPTVLPLITQKIVRM
jgi:hypothetical protein